MRKYNVEWFSFPAEHIHQQLGKHLWMPHLGLSLEMSRIQAACLIHCQAYLILLLEAIALSTLHLSDVLEEVCHTDSWVKLPCLVRHVSSLALLVRVGLH